MYNWIEDLDFIKVANNSAELEKAFIDMSFNAVSSRAGRLMEDPYRIGFEVVYSNDDNSKMAAMYAFRIGSKLISVPVIFANGAIKGVELMYEHKVKLMRPLDPAWVEHLINKTELKEGEAISRQKADNMVQNPRLNIIAEPGALMKNASETRPLWEEVFNSIETNLGEAPSKLDELIQLDPDGVMEKIAKALDKSIEFAEALTTIPDDILFPKIEKQASAKTADITIEFDPDFEKLASEEEAKEFTQKGYRLWDMRPQDELSYVVDDFTEAYAEVTNDGEHTVLTHTGDPVDVIIGEQIEHYALPCGNSYYDSSYRSPRRKAVYFINDKKFNTDVYADSLIALVDREKETGGQFLKEEKEDNGKDTITAGKCYVAYNPHNKTFSPIFYVLKKIKEKDNICAYQIYERYGDPSTLIINSTLEEDDYGDHNNKLNILGKNNKFLPVSAKVEKSKHRDSYYMEDSYKKDAQLMTQAGLLKHLKSKGVRKVDVTMDADLDEWKVYEDEKPMFSGVGSSMLGQTKIAAAYGLPFDTAETIIKEASGRKRKTVWVIPGNSGVIKQSSVWFTDRPSFQKDYDNSNAVVTDPDQTHVASSERTVLSQPIKNLGYGMNLNEGVQNGMVSEDAINKGITDNDILSRSPESLAQLATTSRVSNLFEHGLVGSLVTTYDSASLIENYIPHLEKGLDHFGRILFLLYWKPADFEKLYGSDDMPLLENKLKSQFKSMGDIVLDLIKKNEKVKGTVATP